MSRRFPALLLTLSVALSSFAPVLAQNQQDKDKQLQDAQKKIEQLQEASKKPEPWDVEGDHGPGRQGRLPGAEGGERLVALV